MDKQTVLESLDKMIATGESFDLRKDYMLRGKAAAECQYWFSQLVTFVRRVTSENSYFYRETLYLAQGARRMGGIFGDDVGMLLGHLRAFRKAVELGELERLECEISADDFTSFLDHARAFHDNNRKMESSVIAAAVFEDTVRRLATKHGIDSKQKLEMIINALKTARIITKPQSKKLKFYADIRAAASHAGWGEFELSDVDDLIKGTERLVEEELRGASAG